MILEADWYGRDSDISPSAEFVLHPAVARVYTVTASSPGLDGRLPDATSVHARMGLGGPMLYVINLGANSIDIIDNDGGSVSAALAQNEVATITLSDATTSAGTWHADVRTLLT